MLFSFDGGSYKLMEASRYSHYYTLGLGNYRNKAFTTGCALSPRCSRKSEMLDLETLTWSDAPDYPFTTE